MPEPTLTTVGHGTMEQHAFVDLLADAGLHDLVDVRSFPGSRRNPQFGREQMELWLPGAGIGYTWMRDLGGRRKPVPDSPHVVWRHPSFRAYADHMESPEFVAAIDDLLDPGRLADRDLRARGDDDELVDPPGPVVMCSEAVWWRCHRRLVADYVMLVRGRRVIHLMHDGRLMDHRPTEGVRRDGERLIYDGGGLPILN